ncbi:hypothetical protein DOT_2332 [Desulfosporosinus sp. OT]|nr:hypothetical protein DOT_2332 [Desulfosporosinus sp. OT]
MYNSNLRSALKLTSLHKRKRDRFVDVGARLLAIVAKAEKVWEIKENP